MTWAPLPYGSFVTREGGTRPRVGVRLDGARAGSILDLTAAAPVLVPRLAELFGAGTLDALLATGPETWAEVRDALVAGWDGIDESFTVAEADVELQLPWAIGDYVDFYASEHHAANLGRRFRPGQEPLTPNWRHMPIGYHGRSGTVVVSGTPVRRPSGQLLGPDGAVRLGPSERLDIEVEVGFVVGSGVGGPVSLGAAGQHVFGVCLVNDWSARDIQAWEYVPLGPFLGKSFATSVSAWVTPLAALAHARVPPPPRDVPLLPYLDDSETEPWGLDIALAARRNGELLSRPLLSTMYWTAAQMLAHMTVNGASVRSGDLFASGTVSGPERHQWGSLIELDLPFLADGDEVVITATAPGPDGGRFDLGEVRGQVDASS